MCYVIYYTGQPQRDKFEANNPEFIESNTIVWFEQPDRNDIVCMPLGH